jgi:hypothetical protein
MEEEKKMANALYIPGNAPSYQCLSSDIDTSSSKVSNASYKGADIYVTDIAQWYRVLDDLTVVPLVYNVTGSMTINDITVTTGSMLTINQNVVGDVWNSLTGSGLAAGTSFTGSAISTLGVAGLQVSLYTDQNCTVLVEQSPEGSNWDISDSYNYYTGVNNFGVTVQAINSYYRVKVTNTSGSPTTIMRLQSVLCPIVEALPRSLTSRGNLKVAIDETEDKYNFTVENTPTGEIRTSIPYRLVGSTFSGSTVDNNFWTVTTGSASGSVVGTSSQIILTTGSHAYGASYVQSVRTARYMAGSSDRFRTVIRLPDTGTAGNTRRWGAFSTTDGAFFELLGTVLRVVTRKASVDTPVSNGSFNGTYGTGIAVPTTVKTWEIYWTNSKVWFIYNGEILHTVTASTTTWADTMSLPIRYEDANTTQSNTFLNVRVGSIHRLGSAISQPTSYYHASGQTTGVQLKYGQGNLQGLILSGWADNAVVTLSDSMSGLTPTIFSMTATTTSGIPYSLDFKGLPFFNGLRLTVSGANASATVIYE